MVIGFRTILCLTLVACALCSEIDVAESKNCLISYLQSNDIIPLFASAEKSSSCDYAKVQSEAVKKVNAAIGKLSESDYKTDVQCIKAALSRISFENLILAKKAYSGATQLSEDDKQEQLQKIEIDIEKALFESMLSCEDVNKYIDGFFNKKNASDPSVDQYELFCIKKYSVDNNLFNISQYPIECKVPGVDLAEFDCSYAISGYREASAEDFKDKKFTEEQSECVINKNSEIEYFEHLLWIETLEGVELTDDQKSQETQKFKDFYLHAMKNIFDCCVEL